MALIHVPNTLTLWLLQIDMGPAFQAYSCEAGHRWIGDSRKGIASAAKDSHHSPRRTIASDALSSVLSCLAFLIRTMKVQRCSVGKCLQVTACPPCHEIQLS